MYKLYLLIALHPLCNVVHAICSDRMCEDPEQPWGTGTYASPAYGGEG